jgi:hypothetical protein
MSNLINYTTRAFGAKDVNNRAATLGLPLPAGCSARDFDKIMSTGFSGFPFPDGRFKFFKEQNFQISNFKSLVDSFLFSNPILSPEPQWKKDFLTVPNSSSLGAMVDISAHVNFNSIGNAEADVKRLKVHGRQMGDGIVLEGLSAGDGLSPIVRVRRSTLAEWIYNKTAINVSSQGSPYWEETLDVYGSSPEIKTQPEMRPFYPGFQSYETKIKGKFSTNRQAASWLGDEREEFIESLKFFYLPEGSIHGMHDSAYWSDEGSYPFPGGEAAGDSLYSPGNEEGGLFFDSQDSFEMEVKADGNWTAMGYASSWDEPGPEGVIGSFAFGRNPYSVIPMLPDNLKSTCRITNKIENRGVRCFMDPEDIRYAYVDIRSIIHFEIEGMNHSVFIGPAMDAEIEYKHEDGPGSFILKAYSKTIQVDLFGLETVTVPIVIISSKPVHYGSLYVRGPGDSEGGAGKHASPGPAFERVENTPLTTNITFNMFPSSPTFVVS